MSLLGKLFSGLPSTTGGTSTSRPTTAQHLESGVEDRFTYDLLFPNPEALCHNEFADPLSTSTIFNPSATNAFDYNGEIDLDVRDVRIIIMQEATPTSGHAYLLYDSHAPPPASSIVDRFPSSNGSTSQQRVEGRRSISAPRKISAVQNSKPVVIQQEPSAPRGAFDRRPPTHAKGLSYTETESQRAVREHKEELSMLSNCIFGVSEVLAYKGIGTKVHILPSDSKHSQTSSSYQNDANGSFGRSSMRSSRLAQSYTSGNVAPGPTSAGFPSTSPTMRGSERKRVLITRMFPVPLPNDDTEDAQIQTPTAQSVSNETAGYPFPKVHDATGLSPGEKKPQPKQKRTPMYAVGMIVHLPAAPNAPSAPVSRSSFRGPGSYTEQDSFPSSFNSARRAGWTMLGTGFGVESLDSSYTSDVDDRIDIITPHWDIIMRTLSHLQAVATAALLPLLRQADVNSPDPRRMSNPHKRAPSASVSISGKRVVDEAKSFKIHKTNSKMVQLTRDILMENQTIHKEVDASRQRIVYGIKARQVSTGQGRWGIWREQARLVGKWAGGKEQGFFFFNLLTGFLGNHTEWLQALGPSWYRRRHYQQQRATRDEDMSLPARTIIVSDNKISARRLIFLLAAFLPANQQAPGSRFHRPSTSASFGGFSQSPPNYHIPRLREESLRHKINKRPSRSAHSRSSSFATQVNQPNGLGLSGHLTSDTSNHDRRVSDAVSIKTANLPIPGSDISTRKSSTAATSTATPVPTLTHFSRRPVRGTGPIPRPGSSGSLATDDLLRSLKRGDSTYSNASSDSQQNSRWGSMISGLWGSKRRDSGQSTDHTNLSVEGLDINDPHYPTGSAPHKRSKLAEMVQEAERMQQATQAQRLAEREVRKSDSEDTIKGHPEGDVEDVPEQAIKDDVEEQIIQTTERIPDPSGAYESPVKTSINDDGVIDIDIPMPDFLSFETAVSSPSSSGYLSTPGFTGGMEGFEHYSRVGPDSDTTINVGGWLQRYHPDFALQAVPSYEDLVEEIKASMRAEPTPLLATTPNPDSGRTDRWVDISSAIIADTTNFTIKRIRYRRLVKLKEAEHLTVPSISDTNSRYGNVYGAANLTPSLSVYDSHIEERFIEEPIISMDETLIEAVERIIAQSGEGSKATSVSSSRSNSRKGGARERSNSASEIKVDHHHHHAEVPRNECKKMVLSALEEIVKEVAKSREEGADTETESFLREGVRSWLDNVETME